MENAPNFGRDAFDRLSRIHDRKAFGFFAGHFKVAVSKPLVEVDGGTFDTILVSGSCNGPFKAFLNGNIEQEGEDGSNGSRRKSVENAKPFHVKTAPVTLIGKRGIGKAVENDPIAAFERRCKNMTAKLCAGGAEEEGFRCIAKRLFREVVLQKIPDDFSGWGSARFARCQNPDAFATQIFCEESRLCRFSAAFGAFKSDEFASHGTKRVDGKHRSMHSSIIAGMLPQVNGSMGARVMTKETLPKEIGRGGGLLVDVRRQTLFRGLFKQNAIHSFALSYLKYERQSFRAMSCKMADIW